MQKLVTIMTKPKPINKKNLPSESTGLIFVFKPTGEAFYEDEFDCGGRVYLNIKPQYEGQLPFIFNLDSEPDEVIFRIRPENTPKKDLPLYAKKDDKEYEFSSEDDQEFINRKIFVLEVTICLNYGDKFLPQKEIDPCNTDNEY